MINIEFICSNNHSYLLKAMAVVMQIARSAAWQVSWLKTILAAKISPVWLMFAFYLTEMRP